MPVPESGIPAAQGYARRSGIPYQDGLVKNRYIGRTFIAPTQELRDLGVRMKPTPSSPTSRVGGWWWWTTWGEDHHARAIVQMLREAGAAEVHLRISSPPYRWPCFYGIDTGTRTELLAADLGEDEIRPGSTWTPSPTSAWPAWCAPPAPPMPASARPA